MIFSLYTAYNKHENEKNWRSNQRKIASIITSDRTILLSTVTVIYRIHNKII